MLKKSSDGSASKPRPHSSRFHATPSRPTHIRTNSQSGNQNQNNPGSANRRRKDTGNEEAPPAGDIPSVPPRGPPASHAPHARAKNAEHSFLTDVADVREMEKGLLSLLDDFHSGKLQAFGSDEAFKKMDQVREQQEELARMHFRLDQNSATDATDGAASSKTKGISDDNMEELLTRLHALSHSIQDLHPASSASQTVTPIAPTDINNQDANGS